MTAVSAGGQSHCFSLGGELTQVVTERMQPLASDFPLRCRGVWFGLVRPVEEAWTEAPYQRQAEPRWARPEQPVRWLQPGLPGAGWPRRPGKWPTTCRRRRASMRSTSTTASSSRRSWRPSRGPRSKWVCLGAAGWEAVSARLDWAQWCSVVGGNDDAPVLVSLKRGRSQLSREAAEKGGGKKRPWQWS